MPWRRDRVPTDANLVGLKAYIENSFRSLDIAINNIEDIVTQLVGYRVIDGVGSQWLWDDTGVTPADPGSGFIRGNSAVLSGLSEIYISKTDAFGRTILSDNDNLIGQIIILDSLDSNASALGTVTDIIDNPTWLEWEFTLISGSNNPQQGELFEFRWYPSEDQLQAANFALPEIAGIVELLNMSRKL